MENLSRAPAQAARRGAARKPSGTKAVPDTIDPRLAFLARASARLLMVEIGEIDLSEAFDGLVEPFVALVQS
jgi:hypothetical protein